MCVSLVCWWLGVRVTAGLLEVSDWAAIMSCAVEWGDSGAS